MSKTKTATERKFPRAWVGPNAEVMCGAATWVPPGAITVTRAVAICTQHNATIDELVKASELIVELHESWAI